MRAPPTIVVVAALTATGCAYDRYTETLFYGGEVTVRLIADDTDVIVEHTVVDGSFVRAGCDSAVIQKIVYDSGPTFEGLYLCQAAAPVNSECWDEAELKVSIDSGWVNLHMDSGDLSDHPNKSVHASFEAEPPLGKSGSVSAEANPDGECMDTDRAYTLELEWAFTEETSSRHRVDRPRDPWWFEV